MGRRLLALAGGAAVIAAGGLIITILPGGTGGPGPARNAPHRAGESAAQALAATKSAPAAGRAICGRPVLRSRWHYDGPPGVFRTSGAHRGLPTFGTAGSDFPAARSIIAVAAGDNSAAADAGNYEVNHAIVYFEPGRHVIRGVMYTGHDSVYVGGYTATAGGAVLDGVDGATSGTGLGGSFLSSSTASSGNNVHDTWEYLTIKNYTASRNNSIMGNVNGGGSDVGDVYRFNTIGPNQFGYRGEGEAPRIGKSSGGGYAIDGGSGTIIEYNCLTGNSQGAFNIRDAVDVTVSQNEISRNGLGEYPDSGPSPGASPFSCGCSGGGKILSSLNANVTWNYVHDNYNVGIWFDFDNAGANISHNYVAANWGQGIMYEASYNARITANTLVGNGWAAHGPWPSGVGGKSCYGGVTCTGGYGPVTGAGGSNPYGTIDLSNSGGNRALVAVSVPAGQQIPGCRGGCTMRVRYPGELLVQGNVLRNNFGGVKVYTDTNRYPGNINNDSACGTPLGVLDQDNSTSYYRQAQVVLTGGDAVVSGTSVTSAGGAQALCDGYGGGQDLSTGKVRRPARGMGVYNLNTGAYLGTVASVTSANSFRLSRPAGHVSGVTLLLSAFGGCGPADYFGGGPGAASGRPAAQYWDNCIWGSRNVTVSGNRFSADARAIKGCNTGMNLCGYMVAIAFNAGVPALMQFFDGYADRIASASSGLGNVWSNNSYAWIGLGGWQFQAGLQGYWISQSQWLRGPYRQDSGSSFS